MWNFCFDNVSRALCQLAADRKRSGSAHLWMVRYHLQILVQRRAGGVGEGRTCPHSAAPGSDLSVAVAAQVGEQMVLELIAQVPLANASGPTLKVGGTQHLADTPVRLLSSSTAAAVNFSAPSAKCAEVTIYTHRMRATFAATFAPIVVRRHRERLTAEKN